jgi:hypothetical protein
MKGTQAATDLTVGVPMLLAVVHDLDISMITASYRADMAGLAIEFMTEEGCMEAVRRLGATRWECACTDHPLTYRRPIPKWPGGNDGYLVLSWLHIEVLVPDDLSGLDR